MYKTEENIQLKQKQEKLCVVLLFKRKIAFVFFPTDFRKALIFQPLSFA